MKRLLAVLLLAACAKPAPPPAAPARPSRSRMVPVDQNAPDDSADRVSVVSFARGATVVSRTGELLLESSTLRAIDSDPLSGWMPPPGDLPQSMTIALAARTRIEKLGIRTDKRFAANHVLVERSADGRAFTPVATLNAKPVNDAQWFDVAPFEASFLRVSLLDRIANGREVQLRSLLARGSEVEPPHPGDLTGCWSINDTQARFERHGAALSGTIAMRNQPAHLDGGFDGRVYRFNWIRGNDYGYAMFTVAPDSGSFSAMEWHEEAVPLFYGDAWFGAHRPCGDLPIAADTRESFLKRTGRLSLYGVRFRDDGTVDRDASAATIAWLAHFAAAHPVQLVAHEFRRGDANANRAFAQREVDSLRDELTRAGAPNVTCVARGSDAPRQTPDSDVMRAIYSTVDVEIRR